MKKLFILIITCCLLSCGHTKDGEVVMDKNGKFYVLDGQQNTMPTEAYRLVPVDTTKFKVIGFKK